MPERERYIAAYLDRLPDGAAMDIKSLAKHRPLYGQMAVSSALKALGVARHLRRVRCLAGDGDQIVCKHFFGLYRSFDRPDVDPYGPTSVCIL